MSIASLHHAGIVVPDLEQAITFYLTALDLKLVHRAGWETPNPIIDKIIGCPGTAARAALLSAGSGYLELFEFQSPTQTAQERAEAYHLGIRHICFQTENPDRVLKAIVNAGGSMTHKPQSVPGGGRAVYCRDPFGNLLELTTAEGRMPTVGQPPP